ncbi:hypothetical protein AB0E62_38035, partial [Streptomyces sp. NPDC038707]
GGGLHQPLGEVAQFYLGRRGRAAASGLSGLSGVPAAARAGTASSDSATAPSTAPRPTVDEIIPYPLPSSGS